MFSFTENEAWKESSTGLIVTALELVDAPLIHGGLRSHIGVLYEDEHGGKHVLPVHAFRERFVPLGVTRAMPTLAEEIEALKARVSDLEHESTGVHEFEIKHDATPLSCTLEWGRTLYPECALVGPYNPVAHMTDAQLDQAAELLSQSIEDAYEFRFERIHEKSLWDTEPDMPELNFMRVDLAPAKLEGHIINLGTEGGYLECSHGTILEPLPVVWTVDSMGCDGMIDTREAPPARDEES
jgi:hypothetical protein